MNSEILMTTGIAFEGYLITRYCGVITKEVVFRNGIGKSFDAALTNLSDRLTFNDTELTGSTTLIDNAKRYLREKFETEVRRKGANAVLGIDFESSFGTDFVRAAMSGTAVIIEEDLSQSSTNSYEINIEGGKKSKIRVFQSNVISPFIPLRLEYRLTSRGIAAALSVRPVDSGQMGDIKADVIFIDRFKDTYKIENCCFLDFTKDNKKTYISGATQIELPNQICRCLESCIIIVKKFFYDTELINEKETALKEIPIIEDAIMIDRTSLINELQAKKNAYEMLEYVKGIRDKLPEDIFSQIEKTLETRWSWEGFYGTDKKGTIAAIESILSHEE